MRRGLLVAAVLTSGLAGCGDAHTGKSTQNTPAAAVRGFYTAAVRDGDFRRACRFASPRFYLRPSGVGGTNVNSNSGRAQPPPRVRTKPRRGSCPALARRVAVRFKEQVPSFSYWRLHAVKVGPSGRAAEAVTEDGSVGLELVGREWRVLWIFA